jgi:purine catabolism regulator
VHRNTVRNRIARVAALTGRPLDRADERMELWLALQARAAVLRAPR